MMDSPSYEEGVDGTPLLAGGFLDKPSGKAEREGRNYYMNILYHFYTCLRIAAKVRHFPLAVVNSGGLREIKMK